MSHFRSSQLDRSHYGLSLACLLARPLPPEKCARFFSSSFRVASRICMNYKCRRSSFRAQPCVCGALFTYILTFLSFFLCHQSQCQGIRYAHLHNAPHYIKQNCDCIIIRGKNIVADVYFSILSVSISPSRSEPPSPSLSL